MNSNFLFPQRHQGGLSLIEISFAVVILGFSLLPIIGLFSTSAQYTNKDYKMIEGLQLLEKTASAIFQQSFQDVPVGLLVSYATAPLVLGDVPGKFVATFSISLNCELVPVSFRYMPVKVYSPGFVESTPRSSDFGTEETLPYGNLVKKLTLRIVWSESGVQKNLNLVTYLAKVT